MAKEIDPFGYFDLTPQEQSSETSAITAMFAGIASGIIKVPEGVISLGAELIDLGFDTDTAACFLLAKANRLASSAFIKR